MHEHKNESPALIYKEWGFFGAIVGDRTRDLVLTMDTLYQLSYNGIEVMSKSIQRKTSNVNLSMEQAYKAQEA